MLGKCPIPQNGQRLEGVRQKLDAPDKDGRPIEAHVRTMRPNRAPKSWGPPYPYHIGLYVLTFAQFLAQIESVSYFLRPGPQVSPSTRPREASLVIPCGRSYSNRSDFLRSLCLRNRIKSGDSCSYLIDNAHQPSCLIAIPVAPVIPPRFNLISP